MSEKLIRVYKKQDVTQIKPHLMIYGDLSAACGNCNCLDVKLTDTHCPSCKTEYKYISFRNVKNHIPKIYKLIEEKPQFVIVDFDDYQRAMGDLKAQSIFK
ncbi:MAG: hypothetical protein HQL24_08370 [Candidatus Omnitrophica bacterium]|nr:hypothetical protein [Candidatus Omnitrophota bacterium]